MTLRYFNQDQIMAAARNAIKPGLLLTMATTVVVAVMLYGLFSADVETGGLGALLARFVGGVACLLWLLFGLTALAYQLHAQICNEAVPTTWQAMARASSRLRDLFLIPAWGAGLLLALLLAEIMLLWLAKIPGLGLVWLAIIAVPLLLFNTVVGIALLLALFNIAACVAISAADAGALQDTLWRLLRQRLPELLIYNLGGVLVTAFVAAVLLSPLWLGYQITLGMADYAAGAQVAAVLAKSGFWGGLAHLVGLLAFGALLAAVVSVPGIVISHMTLLVQMELSGEAKKITAKAKAKTVPAAKKSGVRRAQGGAARKATGGKPTARRRATRAKAKSAQSEGEGGAG